MTTDRLGNYSGELKQGVDATAGLTKRTRRIKEFRRAAIVSHLRRTIPRRYRKCGMTSWANSVIDCFTSVGSITPPWLK